MTRGANKSYTRQFREQAMDLVRVQGLEPTAAARDLGMPFSTLNLWLRKAGWVRRVDGPHAPPPRGDPFPPGNCGAGGGGGGGACRGPPPPAAAGGPGGVEGAGGGTGAAGE